ncbi:MAG: N-acetylneuraminate synthase family protein [Propionibacteriaceae bacterium]|jgi:N-acetylneuraminate synthase|nr:N-acetylneuraminate synthase family protein [Propionibacteriaceae bacterium]
MTMHFPVGSGNHVYIVGEIGLNHNGDVATAKKLMKMAADAGADAVKFQKRNPEVSTPLNMRDKLRVTPWGEMTYLAYRHRVEFGESEYAQIAAYARELGITWFASPWDVDSVAFLENMGVAVHKVASACLSNDDILYALRDTGKPIIASTGMSTWDDVDHAVAVLGKERLILLHATSTYPMPPDEADLLNIPAMKRRYGVPVGYSGHEPGLQISLAAVALGAELIERHITLDRTMWGSDQAASLEPNGFERLVRDIRIIERAMGDGEKKIHAGEEPKIASLRG